MSLISIKGRKVSRKEEAAVQLENVARVIRECESDVDGYVFFVVGEEGMNRIGVRLPEKMALHRLVGLMDVEKHRLIHDYEENFDYVSDKDEEE